MALAPVWCPALGLDLQLPPHQQQPLELHLTVESGIHERHPPRVDEIVIKKSNGGIGLSVTHEPMDVTAPFAQHLMKRLVFELFRDVGHVSTWIARGRKQTPQGRFLASNGVQNIERRIAVLYQKRGYVVPSG